MAGRPRKGDWDRLTAYLRDSDQQAVRLRFVDIERIIGRPLPESKQYPAFWSNSSGYARAWRDAAYTSSRAGCLPEEVRFLRDAAAGPAPAAGQPMSPVDLVSRAIGEGQSDEPAATRIDIVLVGCVKSKRHRPAPAKDLYVSDLFGKRRRYAESRAAPWYILSAEHGLIAPDEWLSPYDRYLADMPEGYRVAWGAWVVARLEALAGELSERTVEVHANRVYADAIRPHLEARRARVREPLRDLARGEQLAWYSRSMPPPALPPSPRSPGDRVRAQPRSPVPVAGPRSRARAGSFDAVVAALLAFAESDGDSQAQPPSFTPDPDANRLVLNDPFAFLLGVIFDEGIPAERAWRAPYDLKSRLGHLDPRRIAAAEQAVRTAVATPPMLHRYVEKTPTRIVAAARIVLDSYGGDAGRIWSDNSTARELMRRLDAFPGIGQKKAAMAVELLERDLGVPVREMSGSDIAYDVHVRRVFLRTGLADRDDLDHMLAVARQLHPQRPGRLDFPAWRVGRLWCHAGVPDCPACVLRDVCPKLVSSPSGVAGAGSAAAGPSAAAPPTGIRNGAGAGVTEDVRKRFERDMVQLYERAKREAGYNATYFLGVLSEHGGLDTAHRLLASPTPAEGFTALWERNRLDLTVEALVLTPEYAELFSDEELQTARQRLESLGYQPEHQPGD